jgi:hypothetical protein
MVISYFVTGGSGLLASRSATLLSGVSRIWRVLGCTAPLTCSVTNSASLHHVAGHDPAPRPFSRLQHPRLPRMTTASQADYFSFEACKQLRAFTQRAGLPLRPGCGAEAPVPAERQTDEGCGM